MEPGGQEDAGGSSPGPGPGQKDSGSSSSRLLELAPDVALQLYGFLPVADLLAFSAACRATSQHLGSHQQHHHWRDLLRRLHPESVEEEAGLAAALSPVPGDYRAAFVRKAETELRWRRGQPVEVREQRLAMGETGISQQRLQSMALWRPRGLLLAAVGEELGVFEADEEADADGEGDDDHHIASTEPALRVPMARFLAHEGSKVTVVRALPLGVLTAGMDGRVKVLDWEGFGVREELDHHASAVWGLDAEQARSGAPIIAASCFRRITVSDLRQSPHHHPAISFQGHATWIRTLHMQMDRCGRVVETCMSVGGMLLPPKSYVLYHPTFNPNPRHLLVSGSADASCKAWDLRHPGQMSTKFVHPNHFEEVRTVQCRGDNVYTACYDGVVREFDLFAGRVRRAIASHAPYAVEAAHLGGERGGRVVSVDWSGIVGCVPTVDADAGGGAEDVETLVYGRVGAGSNGSGTGQHGLHRLCPLRDPTSGRLRYLQLGPKEEPPEVAEALMSPSVGCLVHDEDRLLLGTADGRVVSMLFRSGI